MSIAKKDLSVAGSNYFNFLIVVGTIVAFTWCLSQWVAHKLGYQAVLGTPLLTLSQWKIYPPWEFILWDLKFSSHAAASAIFSTARLTFLFGFSAIAIGMTIILGIISRRIGAIKTHDAFSSDWADDIDVAYSGLPAKDGWATQKELNSLK